MLNLLISDIMNDHPIKVRSDVTVRNVAHLMLRYRVNGILIVDAQDPEWLMGVVTSGDLLDIMGEALSQGAKKMQALKDVGDRPVSEVMDREDLVTLQLTDSAAKAVALMHKKGSITIPIFDGKKLVGVIGRHDIINIAFA